MFSIGMGYRTDQAREALQRPFDSPGRRCAWRLIGTLLVILIILVIYYQYDRTHYIQHVSLVIKCIL